MEKLIVASKNKGKLREVAQILQGIFEVVPMSALGIEADIEENGETFADNARIKARYVYAQTGLAALADDSGLCVDALGGAPGVYSARYAGEHGNDKANNALLLRNLAGIDERTARFVSAVTLCSPLGEWTATGAVEGRILHKEEGEEGFGYDPLFVVNGRSYSELTDEEKDHISHRGAALENLCAMLRQVIPERT